jgi:vacuolar-type H+-ATPase subunit H
MPILDSIQAAERKAEQMRLEASEKAKQFTTEAESRARVRIKQMQEEADLAQSTLIKETDSRLVKQEQDIRKRTEKDIQGFTELAESRMEMAVSSIIKKVFEL